MRAEFVRAAKAAMRTALRGSKPSTPVTGPPACPTSSLQVKQGVAQGYAGGVYEVIDFTNTSGSPCSLSGYPGVSLVSGPPYTQIGLAAKRTASTRPKWTRTQSSSPEPPSDSAIQRSARTSAWSPRRTSRARTSSR